MLTRLHIENYKCLRDVTVGLDGLTILIGPNDSGKSSFLEVIESLGKIARQPYANLFQQDRSLANLVWRKDASKRICWEASGTADEHTFVYHLELPVDQQPPSERLEWDGKKTFWTEPMP